jgi:hypothetical protein
MSSAGIVLAFGLWTSLGALNAQGRLRAIRLTATADRTSMGVHGPYSGGSTSRRRPTYARAGLRAAWSPRGLVGAILAILVVTVAIALAISR